MKKYLLISVISILISLSYHNCKKSDFGVINGVVTDSITHKPLAGVTISIQQNTTPNQENIKNIPIKPGEEKVPTGQSAKTDADGKYLLDETDLGDLTLVISLDGYNTITKKVFVVAGESTSISMILGPAKPKQVQ